MTSESPDDERELPQSAPRHIALPMLVSILLHGAVLGLVARGTFAPRASASIPEERPFLAVAMVTRRSAPVSEPPVAQPESLPEPEKVAAPIALETAPADIAVPEPASQDDAVNDAQPPAADSDIRSWTPARIRAAIDATRGERRRDVTSDWLAGCWLEQKERGTRDCTQQLQQPDYSSDNTRAARDAVEDVFADATRSQRHARLSDQFVRMTDALVPLLDEPGVLGAMATARYHLNREYVRYLNGNGPDPLLAAMGNFSADVLGPSVQAGGGGGAFTCKEGPCVYEFTGFVIERPEVERDPNEFRVVPIVPGAPRRPPAMPVTP